MRSRRMQVTVRWGETDAAGIVFYPNVFAWFDLAAMEFFEDMDPPFSERVRRRQNGLPIIEAHCRFLLPAAYHDRLEIRSRIVEVRERSFRIEHAVYRGEELIAEGAEVRVFVQYDPATGEMRGQPLTPEMRALMEAPER